MKSKTSQAVALIQADTSTDSLSKKAKRAASAVGLLSADGVRLAYNHQIATAEHRCPVCNNLNIG